MFASKSGGYWSSNDLINWTFITTSDLPLEDYAPTAVAIKDTVYFMAIDKRIYKSANTLTGQWEIAKDSFPMYTRDPALFLDDDERLYLVFNTNTLTIHSFNRLQNYYFTIDVFNENSITKGEKIVEAIASGQQGISHLTTK